MRQPRLVGEKIYLRPLEEADAAACWTWFNDPDVRRTIAFRGGTNTEQSSRAWIRGIAERHEEGFAIVTRAGDLYIGNCDLRDINLVDRNATLGIAIGRTDQWGRG